MVTIHTGSIFDSDAPVIVNPVNTVGVMGAGLALQFRQKFPQMFERYQELCLSGTFRVGTLWLYRHSHPMVLCFPTKEHWRHPSKDMFIRVGLRKLARQGEARGITHLAMPYLGCGLGGLHHGNVKALVHQWFDDHPIHVEVWAF